MARGSTGGSRGGSSHSGGSRGGSFRSSSSSGRSHSSSFSSGRGSNHSSGGLFGHSHSAPRPSYGRPMTPPPPPPRRPVPPPPPMYHRPAVYHHTTVVGAPVVDATHTTTYVREERPRRPGRTGWIILTVLAIILMAFLCVHMAMHSSSVTRSTVDRTPLPKQYVTDTGDWIYDDMGWIRSEATVKKGLRYFYDKTGVMPYLVVVEKVDGTVYPSGQQVWDYGNEVYDNKFTDEGHLVFVLQCEDGGVDYTMAGVTGTMAKTVIDEEALEILYDYMDYNFNTDKSEDDMFADTFKSAADRIMVKTPNYMPFYIYCICGVISSFILYAVVLKVIQRKREEAAETERILNTPVEKIADQELEDLADKYDDSDN